MTIYHDMVIDFIKWKSDKIFEKIKYPVYFTKEDEKLFRTLDNQIVKQAWKTMIKIIDTFDGDLHDSKHCIYCIIYSQKSCYHCEYGKIHGMCSQLNSHYVHLKKKLWGDFSILEIANLIGYQDLIDKLIEINKRNS